MKPFVQLVLLAIACASGAVSAAVDTWPIDAFGTTDPDALAEIAYNTFSDGTKARIRSYLRDAAKNTPAGLIAQGWLSGYDGDTESQLEAYRDCAHRTHRAWRVWRTACGCCPGTHFPEVARPRHLD